MAGRPESIETTETTSVEPKPAETILCWLKPAETRTGHLEVLVSGGLFLCFVTCVAMAVCFCFVGDAALGFSGARGCASKQTGDSEWPFALRKYRD